MRTTRGDGVVADVVALDAGAKIEAPSMTRSPRPSAREGSHHVLETLDRVVDRELQLGDLEVVLHETLFAQGDRRLLVLVVPVEQRVDGRRRNPEA